MFARLAHVYTHTHIRTSKSSSDIFSGIIASVEPGLTLPLVATHKWKERERESERKEVCKETGNSQLCLFSRAQLSATPGEGVGLNTAIGREGRGLMTYIHVRTSIQLTHTHTHTHTSSACLPGNQVFLEAIAPKDNKKE